MRSRSRSQSIAYGTLIGIVAIVMWPWLARLDTYGFHDWDVATSFRYLVKLSLLDYGELPWWNPYVCGGYPLWGYVEGATNLVSPWLLAYLTLPMTMAIRVEVLGMAIVGAVGAYAMAGCFTKSHGARLLVVALWAVNGRWALQVAAGHSWHLAYAYMPWCFYLLEQKRRVWLGVVFALMVYAGGIYPLPHTVLALGVYALFVAWRERARWPVMVLAAGGLIGIGLSAPKLVPMLDTFSADPRLIVSYERLGLGAFVTLLTDRHQDFFAKPAAVSPYGWHEWGMYISPIGAAAVGAAVLFADASRERALRLTGLILLVLGFGSFHPRAPWPLLHEYMPIFKSQHVPSRFLYPALLLLACSAAALIGRYVDRRRRSKPWLDVLLAIAVALVAIDVATVSSRTMSQAMWLEAPAITPQPFAWHQRPPHNYLKNDWAGPVYLGMLGNQGVIDGYGLPITAKDTAVSDDVALLRVEPSGDLNVLAWSPNHVRVSIRNAPPGAQLIYNMNHRPGWSASVGQTRSHGGLIAAPAENGEQILRYRPPGLALGVMLFALTIVILVYKRRREDPRHP